MKKNISHIICFIIILFLAAVSAALGFFYQKSQQTLSTSLSRDSQQQEKISVLTEALNQAEEALAEKEAYIAGQDAYREELTEQLDSLTSLSGDGEAETSGSGTEPFDSGTDTTGNDSEASDSYPSLYAQAEYDRKQLLSEKNVYLTFDDGPSNLTPKVLDLLDQYNAKATFFVVYNEEYTEYLSEIVKRGHTLALHSYSHDYNKIYASVDAFLSDFSKVYDWVYEETGQRPTLFRFPGGSTNGKKAVTTEIIKEMQRRGFIYYDWNVSSGDGSNLTTAENIIDNISSTISYHDFPVVLMHDGSGKNATLSALPAVLEKLSDMGYSFHRLDETMTPVQYRGH